MPHHCSVPLCTNRSRKSCKKGYRFLEDGSVESYRLCGSELVSVGCGGNAAVRLLLTVLQHVPKSERERRRFVEKEQSVAEAVAAEGPERKPGAL